MKTIVTRAGIAIFGAAAIHGCGPLPPEGQVRVWFSTDAPLADAPDPEGPIPLFDRLRVEIFEPGDAEPCAGCVRDFDATHAAFEENEVSMGIAADPGTAGIRIRARLFWSAGLIEAGEPIVGSTIDAFASLPPIPEDRIDDVTIALDLDAVGSPVFPLDPSLEAPMALAGTPPSGRTGTHPLVARVACNGAPRPDEACVPGGASWMRRPFGTISDPGPPEHQLVVLSPFFLQRAEMTVGEARTYGLPDETFGEWSGGSDGLDDNDWCTYDPEGSRDAWPMICLSHAGAALACAARGAALPTAAQLDYVSGAAAHRTFPWGDDLPGCGDAVWGLDWLDGGVCLTSGIGGPRIAGSGARDHVSFVGAEPPIVDLAGNATEWLADAASHWISGCWGARFGDRIAIDPVCNGPGEEHLVHGASWLFGDPTHLSAWTRTAIETPTLLEDGGVRCARPAK